MAFAAVEGSKALKLLGVAPPAGAVRSATRSAAPWSAKPPPPDAVAVLDPVAPTAARASYVISIARAFAPLPERVSTAPVIPPGGVQVLPEGIMKVPTSIVFATVVVIELA